MNFIRRVQETGKMYSSPSAWCSLWRTDHRYPVWHCECNCGGSIDVTTQRILSGAAQNCGCEKIPNSRELDLTGQKFGKLTVLSQTDERADQGSVVWLCQCDCGKEVTVPQSELQSRESQSCGCFQKERAREGLILIGRYKNKEDAISITANIRKWIQSYKTVYGKKSNRKGDMIPMEPLPTNNHSENVYIPNLLRRLWKRKLPILLGAVFGAAALFTLSYFLITPLYEASVTLYVNNSSSQESTSSITQSDLYASTQLVNTYAAVILSDAILEYVINDVSLDMSIDELADILEIESVNDTEVFKVIVQYADPLTAAKIVDSIAGIAPEQIASIVQGSSVTVINYARIPIGISFPNYTLMAVIGFAAGMCLVAGYLLIREMLDTRIRTAADLSRWEYPLLANVPDFLDKRQADYGYYKEKSRKKKASGKEKAESVSCMLTENTPFAVQEAYKTLRTNVIFSSPDQEKKVILISSTLPGEAKSTTSINLATAFAQNQSKVLLMDCDLRIPSVAKRLGLKQSPGMTDLMLGMETDGKVLYAMKNGLHVLTSGTVPPNPTEMLGSKKMEHIIDKLSEGYDYIIMDTPPLETMSDAAILSKYATDVILVVRQDTTEKAELDAVVKKLELAQAKILGFVFTCVTENDRRSYKKYGYRYGYSYRNSYGGSRGKHRVTSEGDNT